MKPDHLIKLGFRKIESYAVDGYNVEKYNKGKLCVDLIYKDNTYLTYEVIVFHQIKERLSFPDLKKLDKILNRK